MKRSLSLVSVTTLMSVTLAMTTTIADARGSRGGGHNGGHGQHSQSHSSNGHGSSSQNNRPSSSNGGSCYGRPCGAVDPSFGKPSAPSQPAAQPATKGPYVWVKDHWERPRAPSDGTVVVRDHRDPQRPPVVNPPRQTTDVRDHRDPAPATTSQARPPQRPHGPN